MFLRVLIRNVQVEGYLNTCYSRRNTILHVLKAGWGKRAQSMLDA